MTVTRSRQPPPVGRARGGENEAQAHAILDAAWEAGINWVDTADAYGGGRSESYIGSWLRSRGGRVRDQLLISTKVFNPSSVNGYRSM